VRTLELVFLQIQDHQPAARLKDAVGFSNGAGGLFRVVQGLAQQGKFDARVVEGDILNVAESVFEIVDAVFLSQLGSDLHHARRRRDAHQLEAEIAERWLGSVPGPDTLPWQPTKHDPAPATPGLVNPHSLFSAKLIENMHDAVDAFMELKWSALDPDVPKPYKNPDAIVDAIPRPHDDTVELVKQFCQYCIDTYGRFPVYIDPMYQRLTVQSQHLDPDFYAEYYPPGAITGQHQNHFSRWHPDLADEQGKPPRRR